MINVGVCTTTTWVGSSVVYYAQHYYARIEGVLSKVGEFGVQREEVDYELGPEETAKLNEENSSSEFPMSDYEVGERCTRFFSYQKVLAAAIEKGKFLGYDALLLGDTCVCDPQFVLYGPAMEELNAIHQLCEENNWWEGDEEEMQRLSDRWHEVAKAAGYMQEDGRTVNSRAPRPPRNYVTEIDDEDE
jgi:hypothetical protein